MERIRSLSRRPFLICAALMLLAMAGCATPVRRMPPTTIHISPAPPPPEERLSVGIEVFGTGPVESDALEDQHTNVDIRKAETQFMPYHLKATLDQSGYWGEVRVVPPEGLGNDLLVACTILSSNGEHLRLRAVVTDAQGYTWLNKLYEDRVDKDVYNGSAPGKVDPFQNMYNSLANDMAAVRRRMDSLAVKQLRRTTELLFAAELLPKAYGEYIRLTPQGKREVVRLPAEDDPLWKRVEKIGERNRVFYNALDASYEPFYKSLWQPYLDWRRYNLVEQLSIRQARSDGLKQAAAGIIMIAAAILLEVNDVNNSSTIRDVLVLGGTQVIINGINISKAADIHRETLQELADSFGSDAKSVQVTLEGQTVTLTGSVREQMEQWKDLLRKMHEKEFDVPVEGP